MGHWAPFPLPASVRAVGMANELPPITATQQSVPQPSITARGQEISLEPGTITTESICLALPLIWGVEKVGGEFGLGLKHRLKGKKMKCKNEAVMVVLDLKQGFALKCRKQILSYPMISNLSSSCSSSLGFLWLML